MSSSTQEQATIALIDKQLEAYNNRDINAFAATYHDDVEIYHFSNGLQYRGKSELITRYGDKFASLVFLKATSLKRIVQGNYLVDHELAESSTIGGHKIERSIKVIAAYEVEDGLIKRVSFLG